MTHHADNTNSLAQTCKCVHSKPHVHNMLQPSCHASPHNVSALSSAFGKPQGGSPCPSNLDLPRPRKSVAHGCARCHPTNWCKGNTTRFKRLATWQRGTKPSLHRPIHLKCQPTEPWCPCCCNQTRSATWPCTVRYHSAAEQNPSAPLR